MLIVKQGSIKYHFLCLWYDSTWDGIQVSPAIGEHSNHYANVRYNILIEFLERKWIRDFFKIIFFNNGINSKKVLELFKYRVFFLSDWLPNESRFGLVLRSFNAKSILLEEQSWYYLTHSWDDKGVHTFPKGICPKVYVTAKLEYEVSYNDSVVHRFNHYPTGTLPRRLKT